MGEDDTFPSVPVLDGEREALQQKAGTDSLQHEKQVSTVQNAPLNPLPTSGSNPTTNVEAIACFGALSQTASPVGCMS